MRLYADDLRCAIYIEAPGGGDPLDPSSLMNRPVIDPVGWVNNIFFHSELSFFGIAKAATVSVSHPTVTGGTFPVAAGLVSINGKTERHDHLLTTHDLGYAPRFFVIYNSKLIPHGFPVQQVGNVAARHVTAYATTTQIRLLEVARSSIFNLDAVSRSYSVIVFRDSGSNPTDKWLDVMPGAVDFGRGRFRAAEPHLRADGAGDVQWPIQTGPSAGVRNGGLRVWEPNGSAHDFRSYNGSLSAPPFLTTSAGV